MGSGTTAIAAMALSATSSPAVPAPAVASAAALVTYAPRSGFTSAASATWEYSAFERRDGRGHGAGLAEHERSAIGAERGRRPAERRLESGERLPGDATRQLALDAEQLVLLHPPEQVGLERGRLIPRSRDG